ncbi:GNAT family N-acetyltransferase [Sabulicella glaciei]|uniref:GNAT family N-acetyltransferase n=1 Tax=Sabulicella glaciei TaxID=2984948 RepID=A0ABT3NUS2_9PROT|nr:GNAT family N-acetyltransferase [Roseococcus sp. MDT2-1-1]MCW8085903.1 GNAT family N-acetyltransferase [Roseococcus sp. MDT2-1-1]
MIRDIGEADLPALAALNDSEALQVNALGLAGLRAALGLAFAARMSPDGGAFLLAYDETTPPQGPNHSWFVARGGRFAYVDRIVVAASARRRGLARALYADLAALAVARDKGALCCEVNLDPPNPVSLAFHETLGFAPAGEATDPRNGKRVRYLSAPSSAILAPARGSGSASRRW